MEAKFEYLFTDTHSFTDKLHQHPHYELAYHLSGEGISNIDGSDFPFKENTFSWLPMNSMHDRIYFKNSELLSIGFLLNLPIEVKGGVYQDEEGTILACLQKIKEEFFNQKKHFQLRLDTLVVEIAVEVDRLANPGAKQPDSNTLTYIKNYLDLHYNEKINFNNLAKLSFYSNNHLWIKFKEFTGHSPYHYLMAKRIESAKEMLAETDYSMIRIALECGFTTSSQFCHLFKKYVAQTPLKYRKQHQQAPKSKRIFPKLAVEERS
jgi:AraC-like DNA-binding protein